jgi:hypothetical protein
MIVDTGLLSCGLPECESIYSKHMMIGTGFYHMWDIIVTYNNKVGYLLKAYDVLGTGYYHMWDMHM